MEYATLMIALLGYFFSFAHTFVAIEARSPNLERFNFFAMTMGVVAQGCYLLIRGKTQHACPIDNLSEILTFISWSIAFAYLVINMIYNLALMGAFSAPLVLFLQLIALLLPSTSALSPVIINPWVKTHAALSLIGYGALGLASVVALMFLIQEGELKSRRPNLIFYYLPPISELSQMILILLWIGFCLLIVSFFAGLLAHTSISNVKFGCSALIYGLYALILISVQCRWLVGKRFAIATSATFLIALFLLPLIEHFSTHTLK